MDLGLRGRKAIITGGSRGIGRAIAETLADEGCDLAICSRGAEGVEDLEWLVRHSAQFLRGRLGIDGVLVVEVQQSRDRRRALWATLLQNAAMLDADDLEFVLRSAGTILGDRLRSRGIEPRMSIGPVRFRPPMETGQA